MTPELLQEYLGRHQAQFAGLTRLRDAYEGRYRILRQPDKAEYKPDNRLTVNYAKYIVDTMNGFFIGIPIKETHADERAAEYLDFFKQYNNLDDGNAELSKLCSIYGHAYELLFNDEEGNIGVTQLTPFDGFLIYDDSILHRPLYAVRWYVDKDSTLRGSWSDNRVIQYFELSDGIRWLGEPESHYFGGVPMIEYVENEERQSIFQHVLPLIDALNKAISEKANDVDYYADAYLKILGARLDETAIRQLRSNRILNFEGSDADKLVVDFLQKPDADGTQENLLNRLEKLIFHISMVANISEENFGASTGIALKYRLLSMRNLRAVKERKFTAGLGRRYRMVAHNPASALCEGDWTGIRYTFTENIPSNLLEEAQIASQLSGVTSRKTQLKVLSCVENVEEEAAAREREERRETDGNTGESKQPAVV